MKGWLSVWASAGTGASQINLTSLGGCWPAGSGSAAVLPADAAAAAAREAAEFVPRAGHSVQSERSETPD